MLNIQGQDLRILKTVRGPCSCWQLEAFATRLLPHCNAFVSQVDWTQPPRPIGEFFSQFSSPQTQQKLQARLKCNVYYYRANYILILLSVLAFTFLRNLSALIAIATCALGLLCLNDTFATSLRYAFKLKHPEAS